MTCLQFVAVSIEYQPSLLSNADLRAAEVFWAYQQVPQATLCSADELTAWKQRIHTFQHELPQEAETAQGSLFACAVLEETPKTPAELALEITPFDLPLRNAEFWREQFNDGGNAALYFVVDHTLPILLYVGETVKANQRWKGTHDCKRYILNYVATHRRYDLEVQVNIGFWPHAPQARKPRQQMESALIRRWRSPFNKENWRFWGTPFVGGKAPES
jgi:hypothetical protein